MSAERAVPRGWIRALWPGEEERLVRHLLRLGHEDLQHRFLGFVDEHAVRRHVGSLRGLHRLVIGWFDSGVLRAAAELAIVHNTAEVALTTEAEYRRQGIARRLFGLAARRAALAGARRLVLLTSPSNTAVRSLVRGAGAILHEEGGEATAELEVVLPDAVSLYLDLLEERYGQLASASAQMFPVSTQIWSVMLDPPRRPRTV